MKGRPLSACEKRRQLRGKISKARTDSKNKVENKFSTGNVRQAREGLNTRMSRASKKADTPVNTSESFLNELNTFYCRFDTVDDRTECHSICKHLHPEQSITIKEEDVAASLHRLKPNKSTGPDGLKAHLLKNCAAQ